MAKISRNEMRRLYLKCLQDTPMLIDTKEAWNGFIVGFRCYERIATHFRLNLTDDETRLVSSSDTSSGSQDHEAQGENNELS